MAYWASLLIAFTCGGAVGMLLTALAHAAADRATFLPDADSTGPEMQDDFTASARRWGHLRDLRRGG